MQASVHISLCLSPQVVVTVLISESCDLSFTNNDSTRLGQFHSGKEVHSSIIIRKTARRSNCTRLSDKYIVVPWYRGDWFQDPLRIPDSMMFKSLM